MRKGEMNRYVQRGKDESKGILKRGWTRNCAELSEHFNIDKRIT